MTETMWWTWFLLLLTMDGTHSLTYNKFLEQQLTATCPYTRFCTMGPSKTISSRKHTPCCKDCSCQPDCYIQGRCCPDYQHASTNKEAVVPCSIPSPQNNGNFPLDGSNYGVNFYHIFKTCSPNFKNQSIIAKCLSPNPNNLHENTIVSDADGRVFQNYNCAQCNGIKTVHLWTLKIICSPSEYNAIVFASLQYAELLSIERCSVVFVPPDETTLMSVASSRCLKLDYDTCNVSGTWEVYDSNVERACDTGHTYEYIFEQRYTVYKNVFCYLCNSHDRTEKFNVCKVNDEDSGRGSGSKQAFSALLTRFNDKAGQGHTSSRKDTGSTDCSPTEIYDSHLNKCRYLHCPVTLTPLNGKCVDVYAGINGLNIGFAVSTPVVDMFTERYSQKERHEFVYLVVTYILKELDFPAKQCKQCRAFAHLLDNSTRIILEFSVDTTKHCQASTLIDTLYRWKSRTQTTNIYNMTLQMEMDFSRYTRSRDELSNSFPIRVIGSLYCTRTAVYLQELFYCPFVDIPTEEYDELMLHHSGDTDEDSFTLIKPHQGNSTYRICVDKYLIPIRNQAMSNRCASCFIATCVLFLVIESTKQ